MSGLSTLDAAAAIRAHHIELRDGLDSRVRALRDATRHGGAVDARRDDVLRYIDAEIIPHARAEESTFYRAGASGRSELLVEAMLAEHVNLIAHVDDLRTADVLDAGDVATAVLALFESHLAKENDQLIPELLARRDVDLGVLLEGMHELVG